MMAKSPDKSPLPLKLALTLDSTRFIASEAPTAALSPIAEQLALLNVS